MKFLEILRAKLAELTEARAAKIAELEAVTAVAETEARSALNADETVRFEAVTAEIGTIDTEIADVEARIGELEEVESRQRAASNAPIPKVPGTAPAPIDIVSDRNASPRQLADALVRSVEARDDIEADALAHVAALAKRHSGDMEGRWARNLIVRASDAYASAFAKIITGQGVFLSEEEKRALAVGTAADGGYMVPTHLDPTIILTNSGVSNVIRPISRVETLTDGNVWYGVSSAGVTASWDGELTEVSDDSPTLGSVSVPLYAAQAFVAASFQMQQDVGSLAAQIGSLLADGRDRLEAAAHATGTGSAQPTGIFTALDANTNVEIVSTTAATIGLVDLQTVYRSVPVRWRGRSTCVMNPIWLGSIQTRGTSVSASFTTNLVDSYTSRLIGRPVVESDEAPSTATTTAKDNEIVLGDFSNYVIVDKPGSTVMRFIPDLVGATNARPIAASGWHMFWRTGADSVNDVAFRVLQDRTSA